MDQVLVTGAGSYIGTSVEKWLNRPQLVGRYQVDTVDMRGDGWRKCDFSGYDSILHVAGIAHADTGKVTEEQKKQYYSVNCDLAVETARKAKREGVKQFIYMSSIIVYGEGNSIRKKRVIGRETKPSPSSFYGHSKWKAEQMLAPLADDSFHIAILRPPMIYGKGCRGNYRVLTEIARRTLVFPDFPNERSICSIENLCGFIQNLLDGRYGGLYFPQDQEYVSTARMVQRLGEDLGKRIYLIKGLNWAVYLLGLFPGKIGLLTNKAFGSLVYEKNESGI